MNMRTDIAPATRPLTAFADIRLITSNSAAWRARRELISHASQSLDLCYFIVETDSSTSALVLDLIAAAKRRVKVRVLVDYLMTYPHAELLRGLAQGNPTIEVRRFGAPSAAWLHALASGGIDAKRFIEGLATQNTTLILESIDRSAALPKLIADHLHSSRQSYGHGAQTFVPRLIEIFLEVRSKLSELKDTALNDTEHDDPSAPGNLVEFRAKVEEARRGIGLVIEIVRGLAAFLHRTHHKLLLADGKTFIMGGRNLADAYQCDSPASGRPFRDVDVQALEGGESVGTHAKAFELLWQSVDSEALQDPDALDAGVQALVANEIKAKAKAVVGARAKAKVKAKAGLPSEVRHLPDLEGYIVNNLPATGGDASITKAYTERIRAITELGAGQTIDIVSAYAFFQDEASGSSSTLRELRDALATAAHRGLTVNIYTNSIDSTDLKSVNAAAYRTFADLIDCGVHVYELAPDQGSLHAKVAAIGDDWLMVGSFNMDPRSELYDTNNLIVLRDADGVGTSALRAEFIHSLSWTPLTTPMARQLAKDNQQAVFTLPWLGQTL